MRFGEESSTIGSTASALTGCAAIAVRAGSPTRAQAFGSERRDVPSRPLQALAVLTALLLPAPCIATGMESVITDICMVSELEAWAAASLPGQLRRSVDGGENWSDVGSFRVNALIDVEVFPRPEGTLVVAVGPEGQVWRRTPDENWSTEAIRPVAGLHRVVWTPDGTGYAVGVYGAVHRSSDYGRTWTALDSGVDETLYGAAIINGSVWVVGARGTILRSDDSGRSWAAQDSGTKAALFAIAFADADRGWAVGGQGSVLATDDGGRTWGLESLGHAALFDVLVLPSGAIAVAGDDGKCAISRDDRRRWQQLCRGDTRRWNRLGAAHGALLIGGSDNRIEHLRLK